MGRSDQEKSREKDYMRLGSANARNNASNYIHRASTHTSMRNHMYNVDPHVGTQHYADAFAVLKSNAHRPSASWWLYDSNFLTNSLANGSLAFAAMRQPDGSNAGGSQHFLSFMNTSQDQKPVERVNDAYHMIHAGGHEKAALGSAAFNHIRPVSGMKVFPFAAPVLHEQNLTAREHDIPTSTKPPPLLSGGQGSSTSMLPADSSIKQSGTQLTIFYAGKVNVYNDVPSTKAQEIMMAAASDSLASSIDTFSGKTISMVMAPINAGPTEFSSIDLPTCQSDQLARDQVCTCLLPQASQPNESSMPGTQSAYLDNEPVVPRALPQARKASLARFLEKRKERMQSKSPYPVEKLYFKESNFLSHDCGN